MADKKILLKTIWFLWLQGKENAPVVVTKCYESWVGHNPGWDIVFLDESNYREYVSIEVGHVTAQAVSDIIRINLLAKYGGVWVDATCFCNKPLDLWLPGYMTEGFFAFDRPGPDRMISSWFLADEKDNYIISAYQKATNAYWNENHGLTYIEDSKWRFVSKYLFKFKPQVWYSTFVTKVLKVYPYFWFHYLFESIYLKDATFKQLWDNTPKISADIPHALQFAGLFNPLNNNIKAEIDNSVSPVYKLTWKFDPAEYKPGTIMYYLLNREAEN